MPACLWASVCAFFFVLFSLSLFSRLVHRLSLAFLIPGSSFFFCVLHFSFFFFFSNRTLVFFFSLCFEYSLLLKWGKRCLESVRLNFLLYVTYVCLITGRKSAELNYATQGSLSLRTHFFIVLCCFHPFLHPWPLAPSRWELLCWWCSCKLSRGRLIRWSRSGRKTTTWILTYSNTRYTHIYKHCGREKCLKIQKRKGPSAVTGNNNDDGTFFFFTTIP